MNLATDKRFGAMHPQIASAALIIAVATIWSGCGGGGISSPTSNGNSGTPTPPPHVVLTRISPSRVTVGVPQGEIFLWGQNFTSGSTVLLDGVPGNFVGKSDSEIDLFIDTSLDLVAGNHTLQVKDFRNGDSAVFTYSVYQPGAGPQEFLAESSAYVSGIEIGPAGAAVADFNGDGFDDLVLGALSDQTLHILNGLADGTLSAGKLIPVTVPGQIESLVAGDLNGDGHPDLLMLTMDSTNLATRVTTLLNDGSDNFELSSSTTFPTLSFAQPVLADLRGTGKLDLVVGLAAGNGGLLPANGGLLLFPGQGDGSFGTPLPLGLTGYSGTNLAVADFNGDGLPDLVYDVSSQFNNQVRILLNRGNGVFVDTQPLALTGLSGPFTVADVNNDHKADLVLFQSTSPTSLAVVMLNQGDGTFLPGTVLSMTSPGLTGSIVAGDFDADGNIDLVANSGINGPDQTSIFWGDGRGNFSVQRITAETSFNPLIGDVNGDGIPDLVQPGRFYFAGVILGRRDRRLPSPAVVFPKIPSALSAGDVLGDGFQDLLVGGNIIPGGEFPGSIYHAQPDGTFKQIGSTPPEGLLLADLDGDGIADLVGASFKTLLVWKGDGTGDYASLSPVFQFTLPETTVFEIRDIDHDGIPDIVMSGMILYGQGGMKFTPVILPAGMNEPFAVGDFDGDGNLDIATPNGILFGMGNRAFTGPTGAVPGFNQDPYRSNWVVAGGNRGQTELTPI